MIIIVECQVWSWVVREVQPPPYHHHHNRYHRHHNFHRHHHHHHHQHHNFLHRSHRGWSGRSGRGRLLGSESGKLESVNPPIIFIITIIISTIIISNILSMQAFLLHPQACLRMPLLKQPQCCSSDSLSAQVNQIPIIGTKNQPNYKQTNAQCCP